MPGSYNGTDFGGATTWLETVTGRTNSQMATYRANKAVRVEQERRAIAAVSKTPNPRVKNAGPRVGPLGVVVTGPDTGTTGVGVVVAAQAPTSGPGAGGVGAPVGRGVANRVVTVGVPLGGAYEVGKSTRTPVQIGGRWVDVDPGFSDGGDMEQRWGEWGGSLGGLVVMGADGWRELQRIEREAYPHVTAPFQRMLLDQKYRIGGSF